MEMSSNYTEEKKNAICRVCLNCDSIKLVKVFQKHNDDIMISEKLNYIANINIIEGDGFPDNICFSCVKSLETAYKFKRKCEDSDITLRTWIQTGNLLLENIVKENSVKEEADSDFECDAIESHYVEFNDNSNVGLEYNPSEVKEECEDNSQEASQKKPIDLNLECHDCGNFFRTKCKLRVHWKKEHMLSQLICPNCKKQHKSYKSLHAHLKRKDKRCVAASKTRITGVGRSRMFHCLECDYKSNKVESVIGHRVQHTGEKQYACELCGRAFTQLAALIRHQAGVHKIKVKEGTCPDCGKHIVGSDNIYRHRRSHRNAGFPCNVCNKVLKTRDVLKQHMYRHSGVKSFTCEVCAKAFYTKSELHTHKSKLHTVSKIYKCDRCKYSTRHYGIMSKHKKKHTDSNTPCEICGTFLENEQQLEMHKMRHNKTVACMFCEKMFYRQKNLNTHLRRKHNICKTRKKE